MSARLRIAVASGALAASLGGAALASAALPSEARAVELHWSPAVTGPLPVVVTSTPVVVTPTTTTLTSHTTVEVTVRAGGGDASRDTDGGSRSSEGGDDPYRTPGIVIAGAGMGGLVFFGNGIRGVAAAYHLHLGVAVGGAEFSLRFDLAPDAMQRPLSSGGTTPAALYTAGASFGYRFLPRAVVHPVAGAGIETVTLDPHVGETGFAFAGTARGGLEMAYPIGDGALAFGIDVKGHHLFVASEDFGAPRAMLGFGAYADWRF
jgi:hypothetical protein